MGQFYLLVTPTTIFNFITVSIKELVKAGFGSTHLNSQYFARQYQQELI